MKFFAFSKGQLVGLVVASNRDAAWKVLLEIAQTPASPMWVYTVDQLRLHAKLDDVSLSFPMLLEKGATMDGVQYDGLSLGRLPHFTDLATGRSFSVKLDRITLGSVIDARAKAVAQ